KDSQVRITVNFEGKTIFTHADRADDPQPCIFTDELQIADVHASLVEHDTNGCRVSQPEVEQTHVERVDGAVNGEVVEIAQLPDGPQRPADHGGCGDRYVGNEQAGILIDGAV